MQRKWIVSLVVCTGVFMSSLDLFIVNIAFPSISKHFGGASLGSLSWILSAYAIVFAALLVPAGRWADAVGRKRAFLLGLGISVAASAACALAPSVDFLVVARIVQAAGGALMLPTSLRLVLAEVGAHERHVANGARAAARRAARTGRLAPRLPRQHSRRAARARLRHSHARRAPRAERRATGRARRARADRRNRRARRRDRQGPGMELELGFRDRAARRHRALAAGDLVAL